MKLIAIKTLTYLLLAVSIIGGCSGNNAETESLDAKRSRVAGEINAERDAYLNEMSKYYSDYRSYVDPTTDDVMIEFTDTEGLKLDAPDAMESRRPAMIEQYSSDPGLRDAILDGVVIHCQYLNFDKTLYYETTISKSDISAK